MVAMRKQQPPHKSFNARRSLRLPDFDYRQPYIYHIIMGTHRRKPILSRKELTRELIDLLVEEAKRVDVRVYAYCFMPDHVHILIRPEGAADVISFVQRYKSLSTRIYWKHGKGKLWQRSFYDHILRKGEDVRQLARYILENPVRKGLIDDYLTYPFSGSLVFDPKDLS